jgi:hypothetical protein
MSEHSIEYHKTWAVFFTILALLFTIMMFGLMIFPDKGDLAKKKYQNEEIVACIQSNRPAADCRMIVFGSK